MSNDRALINKLRAGYGNYQSGWGGPEYTDWMDEQISWKTDCYIGDWSFMINAIFEGPDVISLLETISVNSFKNFEKNQAKHIVQCIETGKVIAEGICERLGENRFAMQSVPAVWTAFQIYQRGLNIPWRFEKEFYYQIAGPKALALVEKVCNRDMRDVAFMHIKNVKIAGCDVRALRQSMGGDIGGFELQGPVSNAKEVYDAILQAGQKFNIRQLGRRTAMINHLEACFPTTRTHYFNAQVGQDFSEAYNDFVATNVMGTNVMGTNFTGAKRTFVIVGSFNSDKLEDYFSSPIELGWGKIIKFDHDFTGRKALEEETKKPKRTIVTLDFNKDDMVEIYASMFESDDPYMFFDMPTQQRVRTWQDRVEDNNGNLIGISTTPGYSFFFRKVLSLTKIDIPYSKPGTEVKVIWGNPGTRHKFIRATVAPAPYKKDNRRGDFSTI